MFFKEYSIRAANNGDIPSIKKIVSDCLTEYGMRFDETGKDKDLNDIEKNYLSENGFFGVAVQTGTNQIVGTFGLFHTGPGICELRKMTISPLASAISLYKKFGFTEIKPGEINERTDQAYELYI